MGQEIFDGQKQSQRQLRVGEQLRQVIAQLFMRGDIAELGDFSVTVSVVRISPDLKNATVFVSPLGGGAENEINLINILDGCVKEVRMLVAKQVSLRYTPYISFKLDKSFEQAAKISKLLRDANKKNPTSDS